MSKHKKHHKAPRERERGYPVAGGFNGATGYLLQPSQFAGYYTAQDPDGSQAASNAAAAAISAGSDGGGAGGVV